ncbi:hypothetical protein SEA_ESKETIT_36 [Streptomyces phage Esketit]|nr:hypothetical protein SEA_OLYMPICHELADO_36 [Streptomyces phage OlympicHelado]QDM56537.1 hypothetical protein SEA_ESKETIT_36 [Streptomyces phage Esketit]QEQ94253.1 hypothetical protein SEA_HOSHI_36 [Streptomyces phage Hoshi]QGJ96735.1 hypothetical protein SEA_FIDGETORCA_36 [Streptomyces phage FidgetOrca]QPX62063.1 hypothetical protein SEA_INDIGENOUS_36 [Streptomyces phage Indigenous]
MNGKLFFALVVIGTAASAAAGTALARRRYQRSFDKNARIRTYHKAFEAQMRMYEDDPKRRVESVIFWKQIVDDEMF